MSLPPGWIALPTIIEREGFPNKPGWCKKSLINIAQICSTEEWDIGDHRGTRVALAGGFVTDTRLTIDEVTKLISEASEPWDQRGLSSEYVVSVSGDYAGYAYNDLDDDSDN